MNMTLNAEQLEAVESPPGVNLVLAIPGSGKTAVFCHRIAYLLNEMQVDPSHILALTFARKAAQEMSQRLQGLVGNGVHSKVTIGTFHSACYRILRQHQDFKVIDDNAKIRLLHRIISAKSLRLEADMGKIVRAISLAKNELVDPKQFQVVYAHEEADKLGSIYEYYEQEMDKLGLIDMDDLLRKTHKLFVSEPEVLDRYQRRYTHVLCDESQDNNRAQTELLFMLSSPQDNLFLCADDDQSIHRFRGARSDYILNLGDTYPDKRTIVLNINFRSTGAILEAAENLISENKMRLPKTLKTDNDLGSAVIVYAAHDENEEAMWVMNEIESLILAGDAEYKDVAVLYRTNQQSLPLEDRLSSEGIPYELIASNGFYERKGVREILAYLRVLQNPSDDTSLLSVLDVPTRYLGGKIRSEIESYAMTNNVTCYEALQKMRFPRPYQNRNIAQFLQDLEYLSNIPEVATVGDIITEILSVFKIEQHVRDNSVEDEEGNIGQLIRKAAAFPTIGRFLDYVAKHGSENSSNKDGVKLLSIHSAKGSEFKAVFLVGCNEGVLPHQRAIQEAKSDPVVIEEERRLFYVAMTRAKRGLYLSYLARKDNKNLPSRFLKEALPDHKF